MKLRLIAVLVILASATLGPSVLSARAQALRVCADPDYLPYSNRAGEGFENKIAAAVAKGLGRQLEYTWASHRGPGGFSGFISSTLKSNKCDVLMNIPYGNPETLSTQPYYVSSYVFVFKKSKNYDIKSMDAPILKQVKVGYESETPAEDGLKMRGIVPGAIAFNVGGNSEESPATMLDALETGKIDVLITWQPAIGGFLERHRDLEVVGVPNARTLGSQEQYAFPMSMGVRQGDDGLKERLDDVIAKHQAELTSILTRNGVQLYAPQ